MPEPTDAPEKEGYAFIKWDFDFSSLITKDEVITAQWEAIYTVSSGGAITGLTDYGKANYSEIIIPSQIDGVSISTIEW